ncbi:MAG: hypothetical protein K0Q51_414 [Rickettsiaceae bacterium]|nr:hypothetical protein [Rickettsiaceae bacterium]
MQTSRNFNNSFEDEKVITEYYECLKSEPFTLKPMVKLLKTPGFDPNARASFKTSSGKERNKTLLGIINGDAFPGAFSVGIGANREIDCSERARKVFNWFVSDKRVKFKGEGYSYLNNIFYKAECLDSITIIFQYGKLLPKDIHAFLAVSSDFISKEYSNLEYFLQGVYSFLSERSIKNLAKIEKASNLTFNNRVKDSLKALKHAKEEDRLVDANKCKVYTKIFIELQSISILLGNIKDKINILQGKLTKIEADNINENTSKQLSNISFVIEKAMGVENLFGKYIKFIKDHLNENLPLIESDPGVMDFLTTIIGQESFHHDKLKNTVIPTEKGNLNLFFYLNGICKYLTLNSEENSIEQKFPLLDLPKEIISHILSYVEDYDIAYSETPVSLEAMGLNSQVSMIV